MNKHIINTAWVYAATFLAMPITYFIRILYADKLSLEDFGVFYGLFGFFAFFGFLRDWGMNGAVIFYANKYMVQNDYGKIKTLFWFNHIFQFTLSLVIGALLFFMRDYLISVFYPSEIHIKSILTIFIFHWMIMTIFNTNSIFLSIFEDQKYNSIFNMFNYILVILVSVLAFNYNYFDIFNIPVSAYFVTSIIIMFLSTFYILIRYKEFLITPVFNKAKSVFIDLIKYSNKLVLAGVATTLLVMTDTVIIQYFLGAEKVAIYSVAVSSAVLLALFINPISNVAEPLVAKLWHANNKESISNLLSLFLNNVLIFILPLALFLYLFASNFILAVFGSKFLSSVVLLQIFSVGMIFQSINILLKSLLNSIGKAKELSCIVAISGVFNFIGSVIFINIYDLPGVVVITAISYLFMFIMCFRVIGKTISFDIDYMSNFKIAFSSGLFIMSAIVLKNVMYIQYSTIDVVNFIINGGVIFILSMIIYTGCLIFFNIFNKNKLLLFLQLIRN